MSSGRSLRLAGAGVAVDVAVLCLHYLAEMEPPIDAAGGFIDKFIGDAVMALFTDGADGAVEAAVGMTLALDRFNRSSSGPELAACARPWLPPIASALAV